ncbi:MAG: hypothetical protein NVS9B15_19300 [Acidobacteriaceae bacterium]
MLTARTTATGTAFAPRRPEFSFPSATSSPVISFHFSRPGPVLAFPVSGAYASAISARITSVDWRTIFVEGRACWPFSRGPKLTSALFAPSRAPRAPIII